MGDSLSEAIGIGDFSSRMHDSTGLVHKPFTLTETETFTAPRTTADVHGRWLFFRVWISDRQRPSRLAEWENR